VMAGAGGGVWVTTGAGGGAITAGVAATGGGTISPGKGCCAAWRRASRARSIVAASARWTAGTIAGAGKGAGGTTAGGGGLAATGAGGELGTVGAGGGALVTAGAGGGAATAGMAAAGGGVLSPGADSCSFWRRASRARAMVAASACGTSCWTDGTAAGGIAGADIAAGAGLLVCGGTTTTAGEGAVDDGESS
jgi:hypothetical protein